MSKNNDGRFSSLKQKRQNDHEDLGPCKKKKPLDWLSTGIPSENTKYNQRFLQMFGMVKELFVNKKVNDVYGIYDPHDNKENVMQEISVDEAAKLLRGTPPFFKEANQLARILNK